MDDVGLEGVQLAFDALEIRQGHAVVAVWEKRNGGDLLHAAPPPIPGPRPNPGEDAELDILLSKSLDQMGKRSCDPVTQGWQALAEVGDSHLGPPLVVYHTLVPGSLR